MNPLSLDSNPPDSGLLDFLKGETRYEALRLAHPEFSEDKQRRLVADVSERYRHYAMLKEQLEPKEEEEASEEETEKATA